jgi:hypothetical protein
MHESRVPSLDRIHQGKVRDIYAIDAQAHADRHDGPAQRIRRRAARPDPGQGLKCSRRSRISGSRRTRHLVPNHLSTVSLETAVPDPRERAPLVGRSIVVRKLRALPVEAVVRGYLIGSGWKDYRSTGAVCGITLPGGLRLRTACRSRSSHLRPRRVRASTTRTSATRTVEHCWSGARGTGARYGAGAVPVRGRPTRSTAASSSRTPSSSSASTRMAR